MTITQHAKQRIEQRAKIRGLDSKSCLRRLQRNIKCDVAIILGTAMSLSGDKKVHLIAVCRDGKVITVFWEANPTPQKLRVKFVVS